MAVACRVGGAEFIQIQWNHADAVSRIEHHLDTARFKHGHQLLKRHQETCWAGDGIDHGESSLVGHPAHDGVHSLLRVVDWKGDVDRDDLGTPSLCDEINRVSTGLIGMVWDKDFIARSELQGTQNRVHAGGGVLNQGEVVSIA